MDHQGPYDAHDAVALDADSYAEAGKFHGVHNLNTICDDPSCACGGSDPDQWGYLSDSNSSGEWPAPTRKAHSAQSSTRTAQTTKTKAGKKKRNNRPKPETRKLKAAEIESKLDALAADNAKRNGRLLRQVMINPLRFENISLADLVQRKKEGKARLWPKDAPTERRWGADHPHMAVDKEGIPLVLHFPRYIGQTGNVLKYRMLRQFGRLMKIKVRAGADANKRDSLEGYPYLGKKGYQSGVIQLVGSWTAIGHPGDEPVPSSDVLKSGEAFRSSMNCLRELAFTSKAIDDMIAKIDAPAYEVLHQARERLCKANPAYAAFSSIDPTYLHGRSIILNRATRKHEDIRDPPEILTPILVVGKFVKGGELRIEKLGLTMSYLPGTLILIRGSVLPHEVQVYEGGQRISIAHFVHKALLVQVGITDIPMTPYTDSKYSPKPNPPDVSN